MNQMLSGLSSAIRVLLPFPNKRSKGDVCVAHALTGARDVDLGAPGEDGSSISMLDGVFNFQERQVCASFVCMRLLTVQPTWRLSPFLTMDPFSLTCFAQGLKKSTARMASTRIDGLVFVHAKRRTLLTGASEGGGER